MTRIDKRAPNQLRTVKFTPNFIAYPEGSVLIEIGNTRVLCNVSIEESVPNWMKSQHKTGGWVTAEYALLPRSTHTRTPRETNGVGGRTHEIKRLIGRALRGAVDLEKLGPRTCTIDCDVLQADGGTRTAAITGGYVALALAVKKLVQAGKVPPDTIKTQVAAISAGIVGGEILLDLCYQEDSAAETDLNVVMNAAGEFVEVQGTAEDNSFSRLQLNSLLDAAEKGIRELMLLQQAVI